MPKIKLTGVRNLTTDDNIEPQRDYGILLIASLDGKYLPESHEEETGEPTFYLKVERIDTIMDLKESKPVEFQKGKSPSQKLRWRITEKLGDGEYEPFIDYLMSIIDQLTDDYIEISQTTSPRNP
jgi:hypothetical protein